MTRQPSDSLKQSVRDAFDPSALSHLCETWEFSSYADRYDLPPSPTGRERFYWHRDNGSNILAVAHLDTVQDDRACQITGTAAGLLATSGALDDRLGVYVILDLLPALGLTFDILLTTDEEIGQSTADEFVPSKDYDWIIQFDRGGTDVVMYEYETPDLVARVEQCGARVGQGSFSDICCLDHLGVAGFNWGVGYRDYHSARSHAWLDDTFRMVARFVKFHRANGSTAFLYDPPDYDYADADAPDARDDRYDRDDMLSYVTADCSHDVDIYDRSTFVEFDGLLWCSDCGGA